MLTQEILLTLNVTLNLYGLVAGYKETNRKAKTNQGVQLILLMTT